MGMAREAGQQGPGRAFAFQESDLKICQLCGWLNLESNSECFVCGWHGRFERDPESVHVAVDLVVQRFGRLDLQYLTDLRTYRQPSRQNLPARVACWLRRLWMRMHRK